MPGVTKYSVELLFEVAALVSSPALFITSTHSATNHNCNECLAQTFGATFGGIVWWARLLVETRQHLVKENLSTWCLLALSRLVGCYPIRPGSHFRWITVQDCDNGAFGPSSLSLQWIWWKKSEKSKFDGIPDLPLVDRIPVNRGWGGRSHRLAGFHDGSFDWKENRKQSTNTCYAALERGKRWTTTHALWWVNRRGCWPRSAAQSAELVTSNRVAGWWEALMSTIRLCSTRFDPASVDIHSIYTISLIQLYLV